ncbi:hypothetical protein T4E_11848 [Trichinella pseudospiralis]|uniref:Secreted protein n=2 Tax=Trichinella pseudospiralis TaxID=6337 RepID=A0A0V0XIA6_TRIPS|nr:hypothetical protein T4E_11848 [Trichinella pseudospiralis]
MTLLFSFVDMLLRVGGRLTNAAWGHKRPLLLLPTERLWLSSCDEPPSQSCTRTLAALRQRCWVIRGRQAVKRCIRFCITC